METGTAVAITVSVVYLIVVVILVILYMKGWILKKDDKTIQTNDQGGVDGGTGGCCKLEKSGYKSCGNDPCGSTHDVEVLSFRKIGRSDELPERVAFQVFWPTRINDRGIYVQKTGIVDGQSAYSWTFNSEWMSKHKWPEPGEIKKFRVFFNDAGSLDAAKKSFVHGICLKNEQPMDVGDVKGSLIKMHDGTERKFATESYAVSAKLMKPHTGTYVFFMPLTK